MKSYIHDEILAPLLSASVPNIEELNRLEGEWHAKSLKRNQPLGRTWTSCSTCLKAILRENAKLRKRNSCSIHHRVEISDESRMKISAANRARKIQPIVHRCLHCGREFSALPSEKRRFCSPECAHTVQRKNPAGQGKDKLPHTCPRCGIEFLIRRISLDLPRIHHCPTCRAQVKAEKWRTHVEVPCDWCGAPTVRKPLSSGQRVFCSLICLGMSIRNNPAGGSADKLSHECPHCHTIFLICRASLDKPGEHLCRSCGAKRTNEKHRKEANTFSVEAIERWGQPVNGRLRVGCSHCGNPEVYRSARQIELNTTGNFYCNTVCFQEAEHSNKFSTERLGKMSVTTAQRLSERQDARSPIEFVAEGILVGWGYRPDIDFYTNKWFSSPKHGYPDGHFGMNADFDFPSIDGVRLVFECNGVWHHVDPTKPEHNWAIPEVLYPLQQENLLRWERKVRYYHYRGFRRIDLWSRDDVNAEMVFLIPLMLLTACLVAADSVESRFSKTTQRSQVENLLKTYEMAGTAPCLTRAMRAELAELDSEEISIPGQDSCYDATLVCINGSGEEVRLERSGYTAVRLRNAVANLKHRGSTPLRVEIRA